MDPPAVIVNPNRTSDLYGIWDASPIVNGSLVHQEIDSRTDGTYHLTSTTEDDGRTLKPRTTGGGPVEHRPRA